MDNMDFMKKNEYDVNNLIRKLFRNLLFVIPIAALLNVAGIFIVPWGNFTIISIGAVIFCLFPELYFRLSKDRRNFKYIAVILSVALVACVYGFLFVNAMLLWFIPIIVSCMYFDKNLVILSVALSVPVFPLSETLAGINKVTYDTDSKYLVLHIIEFTLQLAIISGFSISLTKRTHRMLSDMKALVNNNNVMIDEKQQTSNNLMNLVVSLHKELDKSQKQIKNVKNSIVSIGSCSKDLSEEIYNVNAGIDNIVSNIPEYKNVDDEVVRYKDKIKGSVNSVQAKTRSIDAGISQIAVTIEEMSASSEDIISSVNVIEQTASMLSID